jgi:hypothetical protein
MVGINSNAVLSDNFVRVYLVYYIFYIIDCYICYDIFDKIDILYYRLCIYSDVSYLSKLLYYIYIG